MKFHLETRAVQAAAYLGPNKGRTQLTHAVTVDGDGKVGRVICGRVMEGSIERFSATPAAAAEEPTCRSCRKKTRGISFGRPMSGDR
jgi:hypothetical protein